VSGTGPYGSARPRPALASNFPRSRWRRLTMACAATSVAPTVSHDRRMDLFGRLLPPGGRLENDEPPHKSLKCRDTDFDRLSRPRTERSRSRLLSCQAAGNRAPDRVVTSVRGLTGRHHAGDQ
jgi:hypothetical protein